MLVCGKYMKERSDKGSWWWWLLIEIVVRRQYSAVSLHAAEMIKMADDIRTAGQSVGCCLALSAAE